MKTPERGAIFADFPAAPLQWALSRCQSPLECSFWTPPAGKVIEHLLQPQPALAEEQVGYVVLWSLPAQAVPALGRALHFEKVSREEVLSETDTYMDLVIRLAGNVGMVFLPLWTLPPHERGFGSADLRFEQGPGSLLQLMNLRLVERLRQEPSIFVLETTRWITAAMGSGWSQEQAARLWYEAKVPFSAEVFAEAARDILAILEARRGWTRKLIVLDLDNTLWGDIVGDTGWENIQVGGHSAVGEAFEDFQRRLLGLKNRGVLLAIASKNDESIALEAIRRHPAMALRESDFAAMRINWKDKAENILEIARQLNLGLQSLVFLDDSAFERQRVRDALPEVLVPDLPESPLLFSSFLGSLRCFDSLQLTAEDRERTNLLASEGARERLRGELPSYEEWLSALGISVQVEQLGQASFARALQLLNKTNQMNLRTRRMTELELREWLSGAERTFWVFTVSDRYGSAGLTGLASLQWNTAQGLAEVQDFVLSCRVMGREIEWAMLVFLMEECRRLGLQTLRAEYLPTPKNGPCLGFLEKRCRHRSGNAFSWDCREEWAGPTGIEIVHGAGS